MKDNNKKPEAHTQHQPGEAEARRFAGVIIRHARVWPFGDVLVFEDADRSNALDSPDPIKA